MQIVDILSQVVDLIGRILDLIQGDTSMPWIFRIGLNTDRIPNKEGQTKKEPS